MRKNRIISAFTAATIALSCTAQPMSLVSFAEDTSVAINATNFPDDSFRAVVTADNIDTNGDDILSAEEITAVTQLEIPETDITDLTGIGYFTALEKLDCGYNTELTELDVSNNTALTQLYCNDTAITELDVSKNTALTTLCCNNIAIKKLDLSNNNDLNTLECNNCNLTSLNIDTCQQELDVKCANNVYDIATNCLDELTVYGFDGKKASEWTGAEYDEETNSLKNVTSSTVTYTYDIGNDLTAVFTLNIPLKAFAYNESVYIRWKEFDTDSYTITCSDGTTEQTVSGIENTSYTFTGLTNGTEYTFKIYDHDGALANEIKATPADVVSINALNFPDAYFRETISSFDTDKNALLSTDEIASIININDYSGNANDLTGIEYLTSLKTLYILNSEKLTMDIRNNTALTALTVYNANLSELDVSKNTALTLLECIDNDLTWLDVSNCTALTELACSDNNINELDLSKNTALDTLDCNDNALTELDLSKNTALSELYCNDNALTELDLSKNTALNELYCNDNALTKLDLKNNTALSQLYCSDNDLEQLDVSMLADLNTLDCENNRLTELDVTNNARLANLYCSNNRLKKLDLSKSTNLSSLFCKENNLTSLDLNNTALNYFYGSNNVSYINDFCLDSLKQYGFDPEKVVCFDNADYDKTTNTISNPEQFTISYDYYVSDERIVTFTLKYAPVKNITVTGYGDGAFVTWDAVEDAEHYRVTVFDSSGNMVTYNDSVNTAKFILSLENDTEYTVTVAASLNRVLSECVPVSFVTVAIDIDDSNFPDDIFRQWVLENADTDDNGYLSASEACQIMDISVQNKGIESLEGIGYFSGIEVLFCYNNELTELDLSGLPKLIQVICIDNKLTKLVLPYQTEFGSLFCNENELTELDLSGSPMLVELNCTDNKLTKLVLPNQPKLTALMCDSNQLTELDTSNLPALSNLSCKENQLTKLDLSNNTQLTGLDCTDNNITELKVSNLSSLEWIYCDNNKLSSLDLSGLKSLTMLSCDNNNLTFIDISDITTTDTSDISCADNVYALETISLAKLTELGIDFSKTSNWSGAEYDSKTNSLKNITSNRVSYDYDIGKGASRSFTLDVLVPNNVMAAASDRYVTLTWNAQQSATKYAVYYGTDAEDLVLASDTVTGTEFTITDLASSTKYYFAVKAFTNNEWTDFSEIISITTDAPFVTPKITGISDAGGIVTLSWSKVPNATSYRVFRADTATGAKTLIMAVNAASYTDVTVVPGKTYYYFVKAYNARTGMLTDYSAPMMIKLAEFAAPVITDISQINDVVTLSWSKIPYATSYRVFRADTATGAKTLLKAVTTTSYTDTTAVPGKTYYYFVKAYNARTGALTDYSAANMIKLAEFETEITSISEVDGAVQLTWSESLYATSYRVFRADTATGAKTLLKAVTTTSYTDTTAVAGKTYYYFVKAYNARTGALTDYSAANMIKLAEFDVPEITDISDVDGAVKLTWSKVDRATSYRIFRADTATGAKTLLKAVTTTSYTDTTAEIGKTYYYFVKAYNSSTGALSEYSAYETIKLVAIAVPEITDISDVDGAVKLTWSKVDKATSYRIFRADTATGAKTLLKAVTTTSYTDTTAEIGKTYYYFVKAYNSSTGALSEYSAYEMIELEAIAVPEITDISDVDGAVKLTWSKVDRATSYRIFRADTATGSKTLLKAVTTTSYTDTTAEIGKTYYYFVKAYNSSAGALSEYSAYEMIELVAIDAPEITSIAEVDGAVKLTWSEVDNATSYRVFRADTATGAKSLLKAVTTTSYTDTTTEAGKTYYYFVKAYNSGTGDLSAYSAYSTYTMLSV